MGLISKMILKRKKYDLSDFDTQSLSDVGVVYIVTKGNKYGLFDYATQKLIFPLQENEITSYSNQYIGMTKNGKAGYVNLKNKVVVDFKYDKAEAFQSNNLARVTKNGMMGLIDASTLEEVLPIKYDLITYFINGIAKVYHRGKCGFINEQGKIVGDIIYEAVGESSEGFVPVLKGSKWGYLNYKGEEVIPFKYNMVNAFHDGFAVVKQNGKQGVINALGQKVVACSYEFVNSIDDDIVCVMIDGKIGYVSIHNKTIVPCELLTSLGSTEEDYQMALDHIKNVYSKKAENVKSQAAKNKLIAEFNQEMKKMEDARVALYQYQVKQQQKMYRTAQLQQDCFNAIANSKQNAKNAVEENADEQDVENDSEIEIPPFNAEEELADGSEIEDIVSSVPDDELAND